MTVDLFKVYLADFMNRNGVVFDMNSTDKSDKLLEAMNNAKAYAQKLIRFEKARTYAMLTVTRTTGGDLNSAVLLSDGVTPCRVRSIENAFVSNNGVNFYPVSVISHALALEELQQEYDGEDVVTKTTRPRLTKDGDVVWIDPWPDLDQESMTVKIRVFQWLPEYPTVTTDFFLVECRDWMLYRCVQELNFFLKEDQRVILSNTVVKEAWEAMKSWNAEFAGTGSDLTMD